MLVQKLKTQIQLTSKRLVKNMNTNERQTVMTHRDIAKALGINRGTVQILEKSAMQKIKKALAQRGIKAEDLFKG
jgi:DNA-directed RNA polymerase specialized sigma24 family protein